MPRLRSRAVAATRRYWKALHASGRYAALDPIDRSHVDVLMQLIDDMHRAESPRQRHKIHALVYQYERDLGLQSKPSRPERRRPTAGRAGEGRSVLEA